MPSSSDIERGLAINKNTSYEAHIAFSLSESIAILFVFNFVLNNVLVVSYKNIQQVGKCVLWSMFCF
jgi:hypothetical protein